MREETREDAVEQEQRQQCYSPFLEIHCKSSGKVRRFSAGTEATFALQLINQKLGSALPPASYIEAFKQGEEPINIGPNSALTHYGDGWKLQTVTLEAFHNKDLLPFPDFPNVNELTKDNCEFLTNLQCRIEDPLQEIEKPVASEPVSDIESQSEKLDLTDAFTTDVVFNSRDDLIKWTRDVAKSVGMVISIKKSQTSIGGRLPRIVFGCERSGMYKAKSGGIKKAPMRKGGTMKCQCPFLLRGIKLSNDDQWKVKVECGGHNHPIGQHSAGLSHGPKLTPEEEAFVLEMCKQSMKPTDILYELKERDKHCAVTPRTIYNFRNKFKLTKKSKRSQCNNSLTGPDSMPPVTEIEYLMGPDPLPPVTEIEYLTGPDPLPPVTEIKYLTGPDPLPPVTEIEFLMGPDPLPPVTEIESLTRPDSLPPVIGSESLQPDEMSTQNHLDDAESLMCVHI